LIIENGRGKTMPQKITLPLFIEHTKQGSYFNLPFTMPEGMESVTLVYRYERRPKQETPAGTGTFTSRQKVNVIDLGLIAPDGSQVGASGSDKLEVTISETTATPGYRPTALVAGEWQILVGAYKVAPEGVQVTYEITFESKHIRLLKGDLHMHTVASDGVHTTEELAWKALRNGLNFLAITDHNQFVSTDSLSNVPGVTLIPGVEWTHYQGHANFLGVEKPYDEPFATNTLDETRLRFESARIRGATIIINHPFEEDCPFSMNFNTLPFDCFEIWNGPMRESNLKAVGLWHSLLCTGKRIPISGGSDYHRDTLFIFLGGPTTCVYAQSASATDILAALRAGHAYITFAPNGPTLELTSGEALLGDEVEWTKQKEMQIKVDRLLAGDVVQVVTAQDRTTLLQAPTDGRFNASFVMDTPGFARVEVLRAFLPGLPMLPALISNPLYFK
jgi:hypothetical protein